MGRVAIHFIYIYIYIWDEVAAQQCNITFCVNRTRSLNNICFYVHGWQYKWNRKKLLLFLGGIFFDAISLIVCCDAALLANVWFAN